MLAIEDAPRSGNSRAIVLATPQDHPSFDDDSFTIDTYGTRQKISRDPTMYIPGQEDKPDPDSKSLWSDISNSRREHYEDRTLKPKREPTMYVDGKSCDGDLSLTLLRDPTMYIDDHQETDMYTIDDSTVEEVHNDYNGVDKHHERATPSYYDMAGSEASFYDDAVQRFDESRSSKSARSKQSTRSKKSTKRGSGDVSKKSTKGMNEDMQKSSQSADWNSSSGEDIIYEPKKRESLRAMLHSNYNFSGNSLATDDHANSYAAGFEARDGVKDTRQTRSFYK
jgi:hypothetical protein